MAILTVHPHDVTPAQLSTVLLTHGLGRLPYTLDGTTTRKINGDWCLKVTYPMAQPGAELLKPDNLIQAGGQLWRIHRITPKDSRKGRTIEVEAPHIAYDLKDYNIVNIETKEDDAYLDGINARQALEQILRDTPFMVGTIDVDLTVLDYLGILQISPFEAIKSQVLKLWGGELVFDNWTIHLRAAMGSDQRYPIRARRNILDISFTEDVSEVVTRLHVRGYQGANFEEANDGRDYIDSQYLNTYSHIKEAYVDFDDEDDPKVLLKLGQAELAKREIPRITYKVSLARLADSLQYAQYQRLERFDLGDTAALHHDYLDTDILVRAVEITRDELREVNTSVTLGNPQEDIITAITAGKTASDTIAHLVDADGYLRAEKLAGPLDLIRVNNLVATVVDIVTASIGSAAITKAQIDQLKARTVSIVEAEIQQMDVAWADISELTTAIANITLAEINTADIDFAQVKDLVAKEAIITQGVGGQLYISRLQVTDANMVSLTTGKLVVKGEDGKYYQITVGEDGAVTPIEVKVEGGNIEPGTVSGENLVENAISARELNAQAIFADKATMVSLFAGMGTFGELFAASAVMPFIEASVINSKALTISVTSTAEELIGQTDVEYYLSTSTTALAGGTWSTTAPTWVNGKYMWSRTKTTYSTGNPTYSTAACITGNTGATGSSGAAGATGKGITSIIEQYYLSTSKTTQTGGSWTTTPPTWSTGKYIWTRSVITYNNPTSTANTTPVCDSSWEAVNEIEVGGRNLIKESSSEYVEINTGPYYKNINELPKRFLLTDMDLKAGDNIVYAADIDGGEYGARVRITTYSTATGAEDKTPYLGTPIAATVIGKSVLKFALPSTATHIEVSINNGDSTQASNNVRYKCAKLEKGTTATGWTPAPEDVQAAIDDTTQTAERASANIDILNTLIASTVTQETYLEGIAGKADNKTVALLESNMQQTAEGINATIKRMDGDVGTLKSALTYDINTGVTLREAITGEGGQTVYHNGIRLHNGEVAILDEGGTKVATMSEGRSLQPNLVVTKTMRQGDMLTTISGMGLTQRIVDRYVPV